MPNEPLYIDDDVINNVELHKKRKKINLLYKSVDETPEPITKFEPPPDLPADYVVDVPDFELSGTLLTLFKEINAPLKFRRRNNQTYSGHIQHKTGSVEGFYSRPPLFIVNDRLTRNSDFIANIPLQDVRSIKIYSKLENLKKYFGVIGIGGMVNIEMMDDTYSLPDDIVFPEFMMKGLQVPLRYPIQVDQSSAIPQFKSRIFWDPNALTDADGQYIFNFFTSDDIFHLRNRGCSTLPSQ